MMIDQISGNYSAAPSIHRADGNESSNFNRVLSEQASALAKNAQAPDARLEASPGGANQELSIAGPVKIGTITSKNPTVSNLLIQNPDFKKDCWNIIFARQNRDKAYTRISDGTDIYYDPATREVLWGDMMERFPGESAVASASLEAETHQSRAVTSTTTSKAEAAYSSAADLDTGARAIDTGLVDAVRPMIGQSYSDMNCYELLVNGLNRMGVRYYGRNGLGRHMMSGALEKGLPMNAYLNGEGLIRFSGSETYRKAFFNVSDPIGQARQVIDEMLPHLEKGSILSFSTESHGHVGIVSSKNGAWTYINSGVMDNPVESAAPGKRVGEESLDREIENWFQLAAQRNESLVITLGKLSQNKLAAYGSGKGLRV